VLEPTSPDEMLDCSSNEYINLTLKQNRTRDSHPVTLPEALNVQHNEKNIILIEGGPGIGKSTLAINICKCWAKGELLQAYDAVILLPLREKKIQDAKEVDDLLLTLDVQMRKDVFQEILGNNGERICFICEGFDELPTKLCKSSVFTKINTMLPLCTLVYTSRPEACSKLRSIATRVITICGFNEESVNKYILKAFDNEKEKACKLKVEISNKPWIKNILHVPINVAIVCLIFFHSTMSVLPDTLTKLYNLLILCLILRHIQKCTQQAEIEILRSLNDLTSEFSNQFSELCRIAYVSTLEQKIIFSSQDLLQMGIAEDNMNGMGLLLVAPRVLVYGREKSYNFLHLTFQEFCAAWHLSKLSAEGQSKCIKVFCDFNHLQMILRFYSGITGLCNTTILNNLLPYKQVKSEINRKRTNDLLKFLYEAHNSEACQIIGDHLEGSIYWISCGLISPISDIMYIINYFITNYKGVLAQIDLTNCLVGEEDLAMLANSLVKRR